MGIPEYKLGEDLKLKLAFIINGQRVNPDLVPFAIKIWTLYPHRNKTASYDGENWVNCLMREDYLEVNLNAPQFNTGRLNADITLHYPDDDFPDKIRDKICKVRLDNPLVNPTTNDVVITGEVSDTIAGLSAYGVAVWNGYEGTEEEWLLTLKQPAIDAAAEAETKMLAFEDAELARTNEENTRKQSELARIAEEQNRVNQELARTNEENTRKQSELARAAEEQNRVNQELARVEEENTRKQSELARVAEEQNRVNQELSRANEENTRKQSELARVAEEQNRVNQELARVEEENTRKQSELSRVAEEQNRFNQELARTNEENTRKSQEIARQNTIAGLGASFDAKVDKTSFNETKLINEIFKESIKNKGIIDYNKVCAYDSSSNFIGYVDNSNYDTLIVERINNSDTIEIKNIVSYRITYFRSFEFNQDNFISTNFGNNGTIPIDTQYILASLLKENNTEGYDDMIVEQSNNFINKEFVEDNFEQINADIQQLNRDSQSSIKLIHYTNILAGLTPVNRYINRSTGEFNVFAKSVGMSANVNPDTYYYIKRPYGRSETSGLSLVNDIGVSSKPLKENGVEHSNYTVSWLNNTSGVFKTKPDTVSINFTIALDTDIDGIPDLEDVWLVEGSKVIPSLVEDKLPDIYTSEFVKKTSKILLVGSSHGVNSIVQLPILANKAGFDPVVGNLYTGGITLKQIADGLDEGTNFDWYAKNTGGLNWIKEGANNLLNALNDEDWDYIILQRSGYGASNWTQEQADSLDIIIDYINTNTNNSPKILFNSGFAMPISDVITLEQQLNSTNNINTKCQLIENQFCIDIIPIATAIQNARTTILNNYGTYLYKNMSSDSMHLDYGIGSYVAAITIFEFIFGKKYNASLLAMNYLPVFSDISGLATTINDFTPITEDLAKVAKYCALAAIKTPYTINNNLNERFS